MTYAELKAAIDAFTPEQLAMTVRWWGDERGGKVDSVDLLDEPWVLTDDGYQPVSALDDPTDREECGEELPVGTPILSVDD